MDINKLQAFIDLTKTLSYTETAEHLFTTQGNISKQILNLEKELGVELFQREHRKIQLTEAESFELFPAPLEGKNNIVFARIFGEKADMWEWLITEQDRFVAVLPKRHPLAKEKELPLVALAQENFLLLGKETNLYLPVMEMCRQAEINPTITYEGTRIDLILTMVASELGITLAMEKTVLNLLNEELVAIPVTPNQISSLCFVRKKGEHSKASNLFWSYLQEQ
ncbi:LysR family transcriptional regulator [Enterococcus songbeiensis]|uniref:LysR family transcriptional regulator n=1 Tax=Enterococcus songbeiensis TaxID=2559927 RepID=UPI0010F7CBC7|nr:LysR family transcriptional regulator [Enterococcus songbeiensis]